MGRVKVCLYVMLDLLFGVGEVGLMLSIRPFIPLAEPADAGLLSLLPFETFCLK